MAGWWLRCGDDGSTKKGAGHASQPVQSLLAANFLLTPTRSVRYDRDGLIFFPTMTSLHPPDCVLLNDHVMWFVRQRSIFGGLGSIARKPHLAQQTRQIRGLSRKALAIVLAGSFSFPFPASAAELKPEAIVAYQHYLQLTEAKVDAELARTDAYLWIDSAPPARRDAYYADLRKGNLVIDRLETLDQGKTIAFPGALVHHWIGTVFIPGATLSQTLEFMQDYDHKKDYFGPDIQRSKILQRQGDDFLVNLRFYKKKVITIVDDTDHQVHYQVVDATHAWSRSHATRIQEVENAGEPGERLEPPGHDRGFLWGMDTYWRFQEKDGGTYVECQSVSLTRDIPTGLGWVVGPFVTSVPRESLTFTLTVARSAELQRITSRNAK